MSFIIALHIGEGLVMASDSRVTFNTTSIQPDGSKKVDFGVHLTDTTPKTFVTSEGVGISCCGDSSINSKPITGFIENFIAEYKDKNVDEIKDLLIPYFTSLDGNLNTTFIVGGYMMEEGQAIQKLYRVNTNSREIEEIDTSKQGALWSGEIDVMSRVLTPMFSKKDDGTYVEVPSTPILWQYFTLQDAIDFARYAIKTTIDTMKFQSRVKTVGGPIDILVIKPSETIWIEKRQLH